MQPLMLAAVIAFWGWQGGLWLAAVPAAALLCASFYVRLRWALTTAHLNRVADFCTVLALLLGAWLWLTYGNPRAVILFFQWLPLMLLPVALAHAYGTAPRLDAAVLFWSLRRRPPTRPLLFDPWFPYYALWLVAASAANQRDIGFYVGLVVLAGWPLVRIRPWSYRVGSWAVAFSTAIVLGYSGAHMLNAAQNWLESAVPDWINAAGSRTDPYQATTDIGQIGELKESDGIVLRVVTADGADPPPRLHRASYNTYSGTTWLARGAAFVHIEGADAQRWPLASLVGAAARLTIYDYSSRPNPVLSLPAGTRAVEHLGAIELQRNTLDAVQITREPGFFSYVAVYGGAGALEGPPTVDDSRLPVSERKLFEVVAAQLQLKHLPPAEAVAAVERYFAEGYRYTTYRHEPITGSPMADFLLRSKAGHCEYFATATALLLRAGGIPTRYATGFGVVEKSTLEQAWVVRTRHAHAWARAFVDGAWIDVDTTPASWVLAEAIDSGALTRLGDTWAWARFRIAQAWAAADARQLTGLGLTLVLPFALWLGWRLWRSRGAAPGPQSLEADRASQPGADSAFYRVEAALAARGSPRQAHETVREWLRRLASNEPGGLPSDGITQAAAAASIAQAAAAALAELAELHSRYRFDPAGLSATERRQFDTAVDDWLRRFRPVAA